MMDVGARCSGDGSAKKEKKMQIVNGRAVVAAVVLLFATRALSNQEDLPWAFKGTPAEGYSIDLVSVEPAPGTPLVAGTSVEFKVTVSYSMSVSETGTIVLVFQDEKNRSAKPDGSQVAQTVNEREGSVTLTDTVIIPKRAKELRLFVPLIPNGLSETSGEVTIRFPIGKKATRAESNRRDAPAQDQPGRQFLLLIEGRKVLEQGNAQRAIAEFFDPVIGYFESEYKAKNVRVYSARSPMQGILYAALTGEEKQTSKYWTRFGLTPT